MAFSFFAIIAITAKSTGDAKMPSVSAKQHRFMEMVAHNPAAAKRVGVATSVGKDFVEADKAEG
jgi:hypothetical protein